MFESFSHKIGVQPLGEDYLFESFESKRQFRNMKLSESKSDTPNLTVHRNSVKPGANEGSVLHRIPDLDLPIMEIDSEYNVERMIAEGCFARILLVNHRPTNTQVVLKAVHVEVTSFKEFIKEYHYSYQLSHHPNILSAYQVAFQANDYYVFAQEFAPYGDLASNLGPGGLNESAVKIIATQLSSALGFMHTKNLVHRDLKLENVLVFTLDFSRIKLCDFGATTRSGILVTRIKHTWKNFLPPEVVEAVKNEKFICRTSYDSWQFGILIYSLLTGNPPWRKADWVNDTQYAAFKKYQERKTTKIPDNFKKFSPRLLRAFRRIFEHDPDGRAKVTEVMKYIKDKWVDSKLASSKSTGNILGHQATDQDSIVAYNKYQYQRENRQSLDESKIRLRRLMSTYGLETPVDQTAAKKRVWEWVLRENFEEGYGDGPENMSFNEFQPKNCVRD